MSGQTLHHRDFRRSGNPCLLVRGASPNPVEHPREDGSAPAVLMSRTSLLPRLLLFFHRLRPLDAQNLLHVGLVDGQLVPFPPDLVKLGIEGFLLS